jgi:HTH-type transcriptional regulator, glycine betaine synthesis regulator
MFQIVLKAQVYPLPPGDAASAAELLVAESIGRLMHFWGFKRPMGRLWSILYLSPAPLTASELAAKLQMSAGAVSMGLAELEKWGAVARTWKPGDCRDYFEAEPSVWKMVQRVVRERELGLVKDFRAALVEAESEISREVGSTSEDLSVTLRYKRERLARLRELSQAGETILTALVSGNAVNPFALIREPD